MLLMANEDATILWLADEVIISRRVLGGFNEVYILDFLELPGLDQPPETHPSLNLSQSEYQLLVSITFFLKSLI